MYPSSTPILHCRELQIVYELLSPNSHAKMQTDMIYCLVGTYTRQLLPQESNPCPLPWQNIAQPTKSTPASTI
eukprot:13938457-Ditylum_brightwellii.AAC.1